MTGPTPSIPLGHLAMDDTAAYATRGPLSTADLDARIAEKRWDQPLPTPDEAEAQLLDMLRAVITPAADADCDFCGLGDFSCANSNPSVNYIASTGWVHFIPAEHKDRRFSIVQPTLAAEACSELLADDEPEWSSSVHGLEPWLLRHPTAATFALFFLLLALWGLAGWSDGAMLPGEGEAYADELAATAAGLPASEPLP